MKHQYAKNLLALTIALSVIAACKKDDNNDGNTNPNADILPGIGLKEVKIGEPVQKAIDLYGAMQSIHVETNGTFTHILFYLAKGVQFVMEPTTSDVLDPNTKIKTITVLQPYAGKTAEGLGIGSTKTAVRTAYGQPDFIAGGSNNDQYFTKGIIFDYDDKDSTESIAILKF